MRPRKRIARGAAVPFLLPLCLSFPASASFAAGSGSSEPIPRPEHPLPQMQRDEWLNLNGVWDFAETDDDRDEGFLGSGATFPDRITVPFCRESALSGLGRRGFVRNVWYRRSFVVPASFQSRRVRLHVGACDYRTRVWVNGTPVGTHVGGSASFAFDVTDALYPAGNTIVVHAFDDVRSGLQPCGKQSPEPESHGCVYTRTTGIWQTVWLEGVGRSFVTDVAIVPDPDHSRALLQVGVDGPTAGLEISASASLEGKRVGLARASAARGSASLVLDLSERRLWSVRSPDLYDVEVTLSTKDEVVDRLATSFGLRKVSIEGKAILLNGEPVFQRTVLDQGFYPDGIWTAPSDAALRRDIELAKAVGFNGARLHQKVFEPRFHYWADRLGYFVWGEFPNWGLDTSRREIDLPIIEEWVEVLRRDRNHPSIIGWCPFNETAPSAGPLQAAVVAITRAIDPTRPVIESSGWTHTEPDPQVLDAHDYDQNPASFRSRWTGRFAGGLELPARYGSGSRQRVPFFLSEYGGIGWFASAGESAWGYGQNPKSEAEFFERYAGLTGALLDNRHLFGFCYTQLTDVEQERNGIYRYDRTPKFDSEKFRAINARQAAFEKAPPLELEETPEGLDVLVGASVDGTRAAEWRYTFEAPAPDANWTLPGFDDSGFKRGRGGFGRKAGWEARTRTPWSGTDVWLRQEFSHDGAPPKRAVLAIHYDNATETYVNGERVFAGEGWNDDYAGFDVTESLKRCLREGKNVIAVHCHQDEGGQFIDLALLVEHGDRKRPG